MTMPSNAHGLDALESNEVLCRRIPVSQAWYDEETREVSPEAFQPRDEDVSGLSLYRRKFRTPEELASVGRSKKGYYVAMLELSDLEHAGIDISIDDPSDPSHVVVPKLRADNRLSNEGLELMQKLSGLVSEVAGPFRSGSST